MITFRELPAEEFYRLREICAKHDWAIPDPNLAKILVGEDNGEIVAFCIRQIIAYVGPAWIDEKYRHNKLWREPMHQIVEELKTTMFRGFMFLATSEATERIAKELGAEYVEGKLYTGEFKEVE